MMIGGAFSSGGFGAYLEVDSEVAGEVERFYSLIKLLMSSCKI